MQLTLDSLFTPAEDITWRDVDGEIVVLKLNTGEYYTFNELGRSTWLQLSQGNTINQAVQAVIAEYDVETAQAENDIKHFVGGLIGRSLLVQQNPK
jgi:hypothetical protein